MLGSCVRSLSPSSVLLAASLVCLCLQTTKTKNRWSLSIGSCVVYVHTLYLNLSLCDLLRSAAERAQRRLTEAPTRENRPPTTRK